MTQREDLHSDPENENVPDDIVRGQSIQAFHSNSQPTPIMRVIEEEAVRNLEPPVILNTSVFSEEFVETEGKYIILYCADITNIECHAIEKCGKYKIGYVLAEINRPPAYHLSRMTQICPVQDIHWFSLNLCADKKILKKLAKEWESEVLKYFDSDSLI